MKEEAALGNPFIGEARGGRPAKDGDWATSPCGQSPPFCPKGVVVELKREIVEGKGGRRWPAGHKSLANRACLASTRFLLSSSTSSCSSHAHSIDQKHPK
jgi:hypothetical protein